MNKQDLTALVAELMGKLNAEGSYTVPDELLASIQEGFWAGCCDDAGAAATIGKVFREYGYVCDPHTASGWAVAEDYVNQTGDHTPMVVLSTASPYKFPSAVLRAVGVKAQGDEYAQMRQLEEATGVPIPENLSSLQGKPERHTGVIAKEAMLDYVLNL